MFIPKVAELPRLMPLGAVSESRLLLADAHGAPLALPPNYAVTHTVSHTSVLEIHQRGVQRKQGVVICMLLCTSLLYDTTPIHCTPLPPHPPVMNTQVLRSEVVRSADGDALVRLTALDAGCASMQTTVEPRDAEDIHIRNTKYYCYYYYYYYYYYY